MKTAIFPGSFDPFTIGHEEIVRRGLQIFDKIIIAVGYNCEKKSFINKDDNIALIKQAFADTERVEIKEYKGLTVNFCKEVGATIIIRGLRNNTDFEYEKTIEEINKNLCPDIETVFIISSPQYAFVSSSMIKDIFINGGNVGPFLPKNIRLDDFAARVLSCD